MNSGGGEPEIVLDENVSVWDLSPDGQMIAYAYWPLGAQEQIVAISDIASRQIRYRFDISPKDVLRWTHDGKELIYEIADPKNSSRVILGRLNIERSGPQARPVASALVDYALDQSPAGNSFAYVRGHEVDKLMMLYEN